MSSWQVQDVKARFDEFLDATINEGPQIVTRRGVEEAVFVPIEQWRRLQQGIPSLKTILLSPQPCFEDIVSARGNVKRCTPVQFK